MEKEIFEILEKMKLEVITLDEAHKQLCVLFGVIVELPKNNSVVFKRKINGLWIEYVSRVELKGLHHLQNIFYFRNSEDLAVSVLTDR